LDEAVASRVACTAGGALTFTNADDYSRLATCEFANGTVTDVPLISKE
jgi:hypothetical protein